VTAAPRPGQPAGAAAELVLINGEQVDGVSSAGPESATGASKPSAPRGISALDRGLHFGDGVFETIACRGGRARFLSLHLGSRPVASD
jgi:hypothetical protein